MSEESVPKSARLTPDEQSFLDDLKIDFSTFTHEAIQDKKDKSKVLSKKQKMNKIVINGFYVCLGMLFFMMLGSQSSLVTIAIIGGMGTVFTLVGAYHLYAGMKEDGILKGGLFVRKKE